jgi:hypothetical protein
MMEPHRMKKAWLAREAKAIRDRWAKSGFLVPIELYRLQALEKEMANRGMGGKNGHGRSNP